MRMPSCLLAAAAMSGLGACSAPVPTASNGTDSPAKLSRTAERPTDSQSRLPLKEFMGHVMERNAEQLWGWTSLEVDRQGDHSSTPRTEKEWEDAESDALTLQQLTYVLQHASFRVDDPRWADRVGAIRAAATASAKAAEDKNFPALVKAGEQINAGCVSCHWAFAPQLETPPPPVPLPPR